MSIVDLNALKAHLNITTTIDDAILPGKITAAQSFIENHLGYAIETEYPPTGSPAVSTVPDALKEAVLQLAAHLYENREGSLVGVTAQVLPFGLEDILANFRGYSFGAADE